MCYDCANITQLKGSKTINVDKRTIFMFPGKISTQFAFFSEKFTRLTRILHDRRSHRSRRSRRSRQISTLHMHSQKKASKAIARSNFSAPNNGKKVCKSQWQQEIMCAKWCKMSNDWQYLAVPTSRSVVSLHGLNSLQTDDKSRLDKCFVG